MKIRKTLPRSLTVEQVIQSKKRYRRGTKAEMLKLRDEAFEELEEEKLRGAVNEIKNTTPKSD